MSKPAKVVKRRHWLGVALVAVAVTAVALVDGRKPEWLKPIIATRFPGVDWVDTSTLAQWMTAPPHTKTLILDARSQEEYAVSHLEGARRVDPAQPVLGSLRVPEDTIVVVYCSVGYRSAEIVEKLSAAGVDEVYNLEGGIFAWANEGRPIVGNGTPATSVHPYNGVWRYLLRRPLWDGAD